MVSKENHDGYVCVPYSHDHDSIELKDTLHSSRNVDSLFFVTATFSGNTSPYFSTSSTHYILARFKKYESIIKELNKYARDIPTFVFNVKDNVFDRPVEGDLNFISMYYLEHGENSDDIDDIVYSVAKRSQVQKADFAQLQLVCKETPKFAFPFNDNIIILELSSSKSHQSTNKYCEKTRMDICRKGIIMNNFFSLSVLEKLK